MFLSYNSRDRAAVERIATRLARAGINPWLDEWNLTPGGRWQDELAAGLASCSACAIFLGPADIGAWGREELAVAQDRAARERSFRLFPVLLPGVAEPFDAAILPPFLSTRTWVDLRRGIEDTRGLQVLVAAVKGLPRGPDAPLEARDDICPYLGLEAFQESHADLYFGRSGDVQRLLEKLNRWRFVAVLGPSGSGKSSLVRAGLIPALRGGRLAGSDGWEIRVLTPGARPLTALAAELLRLDAGGAMQETLAAAASDERTLDLAVALLLAGRPADARVVWLIDQGEELFSLCRDEAERTAFLRNLLYAASVPGGRAVVVLVLRADFYAKAAAYPELAQRIAGQQVLLSPLTEDGLRDAIEQPARLAGLELESGLVPTILADVGEDPGALPLLEHALLELWERRAGGMLTLEGYRLSGGVTGAVAGRAEDVFQGFDPRLQSLARRTLLRLTQPGEGTEDTRRRAQFDELVTRPEDGDALEEVVRSLAEARLVTTSADPDGGERWVSVSHEALIRSWPRLRQWVDDDRAGLRLHRHLTEAVNEWRRLDHDPGVLYRGARLAEALEWRGREEAELNRSERAFLDASAELRDAEARSEEDRRQRELDRARALAHEQRQRADHEARSRRRLGALAALLVVALALTAGAALYATKQSQHAQTERRLARSGELAALAESVLPSRPEAALLLASEAWSELPRGRDGPAAENALRTALSRVSGRGLGNESVVTTVAFSPDAHWLATGTQDGSARLWDLTRADLANHPKILRGHGDAIVALAISPDSRWLATGSADQTARLWRLGGSAPATTPIVLGGQEDAVDLVAFSPDSRWLLTGTTAQFTSLNSDVGLLTGGPASSAGIGRTANLWDLHARDPGATSRLLRGHRTPITVADFSPRGRWLVTGSDDGSARLWNLRSPSQIPSRVLTTGPGAIHAARFSGNGRWLVITRDTGRAGLWHVNAADSRLRPRTVDATTTEAQFSDDGHWLFLGGRNPRLCDLRLRRACAAAPHLGKRPATLAVFSHDGRWLATGDPSGRLTAWPLGAAGAVGAGRALARLGHGVTRLAVSADSRWLAAGGGDGTTRLWDISGTEPLASPFSPAGLHGEISALSISADSHWLVSASGNVSWSSDGIEITGDPIARLWHLTLPDPMAPPGVLQHQGQIGAAAFSPGGRWLAAAGGGGALSAWDLGSADPATTERVIRRGPELPADASGREPNAAVSFSPDGRHLAQVIDSQLWLFAAGSAPPATPRVLPGYRKPISDAAFSPDGRWLVAHGDAGTAALWDLTQPARPAHILAGGRGEIHAIAFSADGNRLVTASGDEFDDDDSLRVWDLTAPDPAARPVVLHGVNSDPVDFVDPVALSPDGRWLAATGSDSTARLWDLTRKRPIARLLRHEGAVETVAISPNGRWLVSGDSDHTARVWDLTSQDPSRRPRVLRGHQLAVTYAAFTPDSRWLVTGGGDFTADSTAYLWRISRDGVRTTPIPLRGHEGELTSFGISSDGHWLATGDNTGAIRLWDLTAANPAARARVLPARAGAIEDLSFSRDGRWLVSVTARATQLWALRPDELVRAACDAAGRNLMIAEWQQFFPDDAPRKTCSALPTTPAFDLAVERGQALAKTAAAGAADEFERAARLEPSWASGPQAEGRKLAAASILREASQRATLGDARGALSALATAERLDPNVHAPLKAWLDLCWSVTLTANPGPVLRACDAAARAAPDDAEVQAAVALSRALAAHPPPRHVPSSGTMPDATWNEICWFGSLLGQAASVLGACDDAVRTWPGESAARDSRGLARALTGDVRGAIADFAALVAHPPEGVDAATVSARQRWIRALRHHANPFDATTLDALIRQ